MAGEKTATIQLRRHNAIADIIADALDEHGYTIQMWHHVPGRNPRTLRARRPAVTALARILDAAGLIDDTRIGEHQ